MILTQTYQNGAAQTYTVISYALFEGHAAVIETEERGSVAISLQDTPDLWARFIEEK